MNSSLRRILRFIIVISLGFALVSCTRDKSAEKEPPNRASESPKVVEEQQKRIEEAKRTVVAKVNGIPISMHEFIEEMNAIAPQYIKPGQKRNPKTDEKIRKEALDRLIWRELAVQEAKKVGMKAPEGAVAEELKRIKEDMKSEEAFRQNLSKSGITEEDLKRRVERTLLVEMITEKEIFGKLTVDLDEAKKVYEKKKGAFKGPSGPMTFEEARPLIENELRTAAVHKREDEWVGALKKAARIEIAPAGNAGQTKTE